MDVPLQPEKRAQGRARKNNGQSEVKRVLVEAWLNQTRFTSLFYHIFLSMFSSPFYFVPSH